MKVNLIIALFVAASLSSASLAFGDAPHELRVSSEKEPDAEEQKPEESDRELQGCEDEGAECGLDVECCGDLECYGSIFELGGRCTAVPDFCFSGSSLVDVQDRGPVPLRDVQIGEKVHVGNNVYEPIYSFGHYDPDRVADYLKVETSTSALEISSRHLVFSKSKNAFVPASNLRVGDRLESSKKNDITGLAANGDEEIVKSITSVRSRGVYAPFTPSGKIVVNDVLASSFVAFREDQPGRNIFGLLSFSYHWLIHTFEFPHRLVCYHLGRCPNERYDGRGMSTTWVAPVLRVVHWGAEQGDLFKNLVLLVFALPILFAFAVAEAILSHAAAAVALVTLFVTILVGSHHVLSRVMMKSEK